MQEHLNDLRVGGRPMTREELAQENKKLKEEKEELKDSLEEILTMVSTIEHNLEKYEEVGLDHFEYALKKTRELKDYVIETLESDK